MILAIDPAFKNFGCSIINRQHKIINVGTIQTTPTKNKLLRVADDDIQRITYISGKLSKIIHHYNIKGILGELPPSSSKSQKGAKGLAMAMALSIALFTELRIPTEWATPEEVKEAMTGKKTASKEAMMIAACRKYNWNITTKNIRSKKDKSIVQRIDNIYHPLGKSMGKNKFEHIADSLGAYEALKNTNVAKMFLD